MSTILKQPTKNLKPTELGKECAVKHFLKPLQSFFDNPDITEISLNKPCHIWTKTISGWESHPMPELTETYIQGFITALVTYNRISPKSLMSLTLPDGHRGTVAMPPAVIDGTLAFSIRKHSLVVKTIADLEEEGAFKQFIDASFNKPKSQERISLLTQQNFTRLEPFEVELLRLKREGSLRKFLENCVLYKRNIIIAGKTGSGKTTFARSLIESVPLQERLITIEDVHELFLENHPNRVHMLYGSSHITAEECLAACMRLSPDRIFLAEIRGHEAWEYLTSLNTGHPGSITTVHANSALQTFERIATLIKQSPVGQHIDMNSIKMVLYTTLDVVLFFQERKLRELFYDPLFSKEKRA